MKKIKFLFAAVAVLISGNAMAQKVVCPDVTIDKGDKAELVFSIESDQESTLAEFFLTMPEGISIEKNSKGRYLFTKGDMPTEDHTVTVTDKKNGDVYVLLKNEYGDNFESNSGTLITLPIVADETAVSGPNVIKVTGVNITNLEPKQINTETEFDITVTVSGATGISDVNGAAAGSLGTFKAVKKNQIVVVSNGNEFTVGGAASK